MSALSIGVSIVGATFLSPVAIHFWPRKFVEDGFEYTKYPVGRYNGGSLANPTQVKSGYTWTTFNRLRKEFKKNEKRKVFLDCFRFDDEYVRRSRMNKTIKKYAEETEIYADPINLTEGMLLVGKMGSGKTEAYFNILSQNWYERAIIHQVKAGDFSSKLLITPNDMLFSPYDERGWVWDIMSENSGLISTFFENYMNAVMGDKKDYFSSTSQRLYNELLQKIKVKYKDIDDSALKWKLFIRDIKTMFIEMDSGSQNSQKDVKGTMESIMEPLEIMAWKMQDPKVKKFIIKDFFAKTGGARLILDNLPDYSKALTPLFTAFMACTSQVHMTLPLKRSNITLYALDEYLSMLRFLDEDSKHRLHTLIRGKGGVLMPGVQYIPSDDKKLKQALTSSAFCWMFFSVIEEESVKLLKETVGQTEYHYVEKSETVNDGNKKSRTYNQKESKTHLISNDLLNSLGKKFEHITYFPTHKVLYKGYTPQVDLLTIAAETTPLNLTPFYEMKYANEEKAESLEELQNLTFADLFKQKPLSKIEEYKLWKKFNKAKNQGEEEVEKFKKEENLVQTSLDFLFKKFIKNEQVISNKMRLLSIEERTTLSREWTLLEKEGDDAKQFEFISKNDLFGAMPDIFVPTEVEWEDV